jgi:bifunctional N-acetylglucosamine-1-phosphate-uridyltransferase/glucosamine-1-phosphate-acetyltransferase GlmU-like protein
LQPLFGHFRKSFMSLNTPFPIDVVVMAAGKGTRMKSRLPKVLQRLAGVPLVQHVINTAAQLNARSAVVITGHGADQVEPPVRRWRCNACAKSPSWAQATPCNRRCPRWPMMEWW